MKKMKEPLVTISLKEYNNLLGIKKALDDKNKIILKTYDDYIDGIIYLDDDALPRIKKIIQSELDEYIPVLEREQNTKLQAIQKSKTWYQSLIDKI